MKQRPNNGSKRSLLVVLFTLFAFSSWMGCAEQSSKTSLNLGTNAQNLSMNTGGSVPLYVEGGKNIGSVSVDNDADNINVKYTTTGDWKITKTAVAVASSCDKIPNQAPTAGDCPKGDCKYNCENKTLTKKVCKKVKVKKTYTCRKSRTKCEEKKYSCRKCHHKCEVKKVRCGGGEKKCYDKKYTCQKTRKKCCDHKYKCNKTIRKCGKEAYKCARDVKVCKKVAYKCTQNRPHCVNKAYKVKVCGKVCTKQKCNGGYRTVCGYKCHYKTVYKKVCSNKPCPGTCYKMVCGIQKQHGICYRNVCKDVTIAGVCVKKVCKDETYNATCTKKVCTTAPVKYCDKKECRSEYYNATCTKKECRTEFYDATCERYVYVNKCEEKTYTKQICSEGCKDGNCYKRSCKDKCYHKTVIQKECKKVKVNVPYACGKNCTTKCYEKKYGCPKKVQKCGIQTYKCSKTIRKCGKEAYKCARDVKVCKKVAYKCTQNRPHCVNKAYKVKVCGKVCTKQKCNGGYRTVCGYKCHYKTVYKKVCSNKPCPGTCYKMVCGIQKQHGICYRNACKDITVTGICAKKVCKEVVVPAICVKKECKPVCTVKYCTKQIEKEVCLPKIVKKKVCVPNGNCQYTMCQKDEIPCCQNKLLTDKFNSSKSHNPGVMAYTANVGIAGTGVNPGESACVAVYVEASRVDANGNVLETSSGWAYGERENNQTCWKRTFNYTVENVCKDFTLPPDGTKVTVTYQYPGTGFGVPSYFDIGLSNVPSGFSITNQTYDGWCIESRVGTGLGPYQAMAFSSLDPNLASKCQKCVQDKKWDKIHYILNQDYYTSLGATFQDVQNAIWVFTEPNPKFDSAFTATAQAIVDDANANGAGFVPKAGQYAAVIFTVVGAQTTIIRVKLDCAKGGQVPPSNTDVPQDTSPGSSAAAE